MTNEVEKPFSVTLDLDKCEIFGDVIRKLSVTTLSKLIDFVHDRNKAEEILKSGEDPLIYEVVGFETPKVEGNLSAAITILNSGKIGDEYYMTKGHFHKKESASEIYICLSGRGLLLMQNRKGEVDVQEMARGRVIYVPPGWAHRAINIGSTKLIFLAIYPSDAGHDYGAIKERGFRKIVIERDGKPSIEDNPRWRD